MDDKLSTTIMSLKNFCKYVLCMYGSISVCVGMYVYSLFKQNNFERAEMIIYFV